MNSAFSGIEIFAEAGPTIGLGHLKRMEFLLYLAREELHQSVRGFTLCLGGGTDPVATSEFEVLTTRKDLYEQVERDSDLKKLVVLDLKWSGVSESDFEKLRSLSTPHRRFLFIDGPEIELRGTPTRLFPTFALSKGLQMQRNVFFGPRYVLAARGGDLPNSDSCIVLTGSTAHDSFVDQINRIASDSQLSEMPFTWGVGPFLEEPTVGVPLAPNVTAQNFPKVADILGDYGMALCRFGVSATETISRGLPTVILPGWASSEEHSVLEIERLGLALVARSERETTALLSQLRTDLSLRESIHKAAHEIFEPHARHPAIDVLEAIIEEVT